MKLTRANIGSIWGRFIVYYNQAGMVQGFVNSVVLLVMLYSTTIKPAVDVPVWLYILIVIIGIGLLVLFIRTIGITGYFSYFKQLSALSELERMITSQQNDLALIKKHLGIEET
ncbi:hypothetical protein ACFLW0_07700 [Chloroflexota bacterium]